MTEKDAYLVDAIELYARAFKEVYKANPNKPVDIADLTADLMTKMTDDTFQGMIHVQGTLYDE